MKSRLLSLAAVLALLLPARAHDDHIAGEMAIAAQHLLATLSPEQKAKAQFQMTDEERKNWHFIPRVRKGLPLKEMNQGQRLLAQALLATGLSPQGYGKAVGIMSLEDVLKEIEQGKGPVRDPENYFVSIFGDPSAKAGWGWRFEGHHLTLNFAAGGGDVSVTPSFFGTNPGEVREGPRQGTRFLAPEGRRRHGDRAQGRYQRPRPKRVHQARGPRPNEANRRAKSGAGADHSPLPRAAPERDRGGGMGEG
jgi:hypothetical protein